jgi:hypothetical protein
VVIGWYVGWVQSMGSGYGYFFLISDGAYGFNFFLLSDGRERERERESVCVTEIGRDRECSLNIYFLISMVC